MQTKWLLTVAWALVPAAPSLCAAQNFPTKPIRFIIPTAAGGGSDQIVRFLGNRYTAAWGQQIVADNRPGAGMVIGIDIATKATPDGHTLVLVNPSHAINATLMARLPYDPVNDLIPISVVATQAYGLVVPNSLPVRSIKELIAYAKSKPRELSFGSSGPGSASHLAGEMFTGMTGTQMAHIAYKGTGPALTDLIPGRVHLYINPMLAIINQVNAGQLRLLAVTSPKRVSSLPDVPTVAEAGVPGYEASSWYMVLAPRDRQRAQGKRHARHAGQGRHRSAGQHARGGDGVSQSRNRALGQGDQAGASAATIMHVTHGHVIRSS
jgi:tripartite-type tricarboxylate transporter receptor subunit TctC